MGSSQLLGKAEEMLVDNLAIDWQVRSSNSPSHLIYGN